MITPENRRDPRYIGGSGTRGMAGRNQQGVLAALVQQRRQIARSSTAKNTAEKLAREFKLRKVDEQIRQARRAMTTERMAADGRALAWDIR